MKKFTLPLLFIILLSISNGFYKYYLSGGVKLGNVGDIINFLADTSLSFVSLLVDREKFISLNFNQSLIINDEIITSNNELNNMSVSYESFLDDYIIQINRYDPSLKSSVIDFVDLKTNKVIFSTTHNIESVWNDYFRNDKELLRRQSKSLWRNFHSYIDDNGYVYSAEYSPIVKFDICGNYIDHLPGNFHHSLEYDGENFYKPNKTSNPKYRYESATIVKFNSNLDVVSETDIIDILESNNMGYMINDSSNQNDILHVNDIQPVQNSGNYWQKGDLFVSLRNISLIFLYRPSTNQVIWYKKGEGSFSFQHDIEIIDDHTISIFDNNVIFNGHELVFNDMDSFSNLVVYDFSKDKFTFDYGHIFKKFKIRAVNEGRGKIYDKFIFIEDNESGKILITDHQGNLLWKYLNNYDGNFYITSWSKLISKNKVDNILNKSVECKQ